MFYLLIGAVAVAVVWTAVAVSTGRLRVDPLAEATRSTPDHGLPAVPAARDIDSVRFDTAPLGYRPTEVDARLDELRDILADREQELAGLRTMAPGGDAPDDGDPRAGEQTADDAGHATGEPPADNARLATGEPPASDPAPEGARADDSAERA